MNLLIIFINCLKFSHIKTQFCNKMHQILRGDSKLQFQTCPNILENIYAIRAHNKNYIYTYNNIFFKHILRVYVKMNLSNHGLKCITMYVSII